VHGADVGRWLGRRLSGWAKLSEGQRERLEQLGIEAPEAPEAEAAERPAPRGGRAAAWERGLAAARQYLEREGHLTIPRTHTEL
jgi:hypothetical protein